MRGLLAFSAVALMAFASMAAGGSESQAAVSAQVIDRTLLCSVAERGGVRVLTVAADAGGFEREDPATGKKTKELPSFSVWTGLGFANGISSGNLASAAAGRGRDGYVWIADRSKCSRATKRVRLSARDLEGGPASQLGDEYDCITPRKVLIRIRAVFGRRTSLRPNSRFRLLMANGFVRESYLAIQTPAGKPMIFAAAREPARAWIFTALDCSSD